MAPSNSQPPPSNPAAAWEWILDEAAIRDDGGTEDIALVVDSDTMRRLAYRPPTAAYERVLWESTRPIDPDQATIASSAGWIMPQDPDTKPVFVAHSMLAAVWLLRMSLPATCIPSAMWAQLAQSAAIAGTTSPAHNTGTHSHQERSPQSPTTGKRRRVASVAEEVEEEESEETDEQAASDAVSGRHSGRKLTTSVSNHNRRAEKQRDAKRLKAAARRRQALGLEVPRLDAPAAETAAHRAITPADEPTVAWIIKQPAGSQDFFNTTKHPYATANTMLRCARAIGNDTAKIHAAYFVHNWRRSGNPLLLESNTSALVRQAAAAAASSQAIAQDPFHVEWAAVTFSEAVTATAGVVYRWGMASLGRRYQRKIDALKSAASSTTDALAHQGNDQQLRNQAKKAIWEEKKPPCSWQAYNARLKRSRRWYQAAETLGWGLLVLIPADTVTPNWVEQTLRAAEWEIWLQLVQRVNPGAVEASRSFDEWLGVQGLEHGSLNGAKMLRIEMAQGSRITEVADSDDDDDDEEGAAEDGEHDTGHDTIARSTTDAQRPATASFLQSLELRQLFEPHDTQRL